MHLQKTKLISQITLGLVLYLLLFSVFALFHTYTNNELSDPQGCQIGLWVQHGQQTLLAGLVPAPCLLVLFYIAPNLQFAFSSLVLSAFSARAPPAFSFR